METRMADGPVIQFEKPIVLLGMMGAGKSSLGVRLVGMHVRKNATGKAAAIAVLATEQLNS